MGHVLSPPHKATPIAIIIDINRNDRNIPFFCFFSFFFFRRKATLINFDEESYIFTIFYRNFILIDKINISVAVISIVRAIAGDQ